jgi:type VI secretion system protein ImpK
MNLFDLTHDWFAYVRLVAREGENFQVSAAEVKERLISMMEDMERKASQEMDLRSDFEEVKYALIVFADEVLNTSAWPESGSWANDRLEMHVYQTMIGGEKFFKDLDALRKRRADAEILGVYYLCIALGFKGIHFGNPEQLISIQMELCNAMPQRLNSRMDDLFPEASACETRDYTPRPAASVGKAIFIAAIATVLFLIVSTILLEIAIGE